MKKIICFMLVIVMFAALVGCGAGAGGGKAGSTSRTNPAKVGEPVVYDGMKDSYPACKLEITLLEVVRGGAALKMAKEANGYNDVPEDGKEYLLAKFEVTALQSKGDEAIDLQYSFEIVRSDGSTYEDSFAYISDVKTLTTMYEGATQEGYVCFTVDKNDANLLIAFPSYGKSQLWFSGKPTTGSEYEDYNPLGDPNRVGAKSNPAKLGQVANFNGTDLGSYGLTFNANVTITELNRGQRALDMATMASKYNDAPPAGKEYIIAKVKIEAISSKNDESLGISDYYFSLFSSDGIEYTDRAYVRDLEGGALSDMYPGAVQEAYVSFLVNENDSNPSIVAFNSSEVSVWFSAEEANTEPLIDPNAVVLGSRKTPVPFGDSQTFDNLKNTYDAYKVDLTILEMLRGKDAEDMLKETKARLPALEDGKELLIVKLRVAALESKDDAKVNVRSYDFGLVSSSGNKYESAYVFGSNLSELSEMYEGAMQEAYLFFQVDSSDEAPLLVFKEGYDNPGIWFALK